MKITKRLELVFIQALLALLTSLPAMSQEIVEPVSDSQSSSSTSSSAQEEEIEDIDSQKKLRETETKSSEREILGWVERVILYPEKISLDAKLTPGSEGNILHAMDVTTLKKDGKEFVKFKTLNRKGKPVEVEKEIIQKTKFRRTDGSVEKRYVIRSGVCISTKYIELDFALADRAGFEQESRIGRDALAGHFLVDPGRVKVTKPKCFASEKNKKNQ